MQYIYIFIYIIYIYIYIYVYEKKREIQREREIKNFQTWSGCPVQNIVPEKNIFFYLTWLFVFFPRVVCKCQGIVSKVNIRSPTKACNSDSRRACINYAQTRHRSICCTREEMRVRFDLFIDVRTFCITGRYRISILTSTIQVIA